MNRSTIFFAVLFAGLLTSQAFAQPDSLWSKTFGASGQDSLWGMIKTSDGGWALAGYFNSEDVGGANILFLKLNSEFNHEMDYGADYSEFETAHGITETPDNGFVLTGFTSDSPENHRRSGIITKIDSQGHEEWARFTDNSEYSETFSAVAFPNGDIAVGGTWYPGGDAHDDFAIWSIDARAQPQWMQHYGTPEASEYGLSMIKRADGGLALAGQTMTFGQHGVDAGAMMLVLTDQYGAQQELKTYSQENCIAWAMDVIQTANGGFALCGAIGYNSPESGVTNWNIWLVTTDAEGDLQSSNEYDLGHDEWGMGIIQLADGDFVLTGATGDNNEWALENADCFLLRTNSDGEVRWQTTYGGDGHDFGMKVFPTGDGGYLIGGTTSSIGAGECDFWLLKTGRDPLSIPTEPPAHSAFFTLHSAFPNPFNSSTTITYDIARPGFIRLGVYDIGGRLVGTVKEGYATPGSYSTVWNGEGAASGSYSIIIESSDKNQISKSIQLVK